MKSTRHLHLRHQTNHKNAGPSNLVRDESVDQDFELASVSGYIPLSPRAIAQQTAGMDGDGAAYLKRLIAK